MRLDPAGVRLVEPALQVRALGSVPAGQADDLGDPTVQGDESPTARGLVQTVDVLGDEEAAGSPRLELGEGMVTRVGRSAPMRCQPMWERAQ